MLLHFTIYRGNMWKQYQTLQSNNLFNNSNTKHEDPARKSLQSMMLSVLSVS